MFGHVQHLIIYYLYLNNEDLRESNQLTGQMVFCNFG